MAALSEGTDKADSAVSSQRQTPKPLFVCSVCTDEVKAKYLCQPCKKYFCEKCKTAHTANAASAKHKFTEILETESETPDLSLDLAVVSSPEAQKFPSNANLSSNSPKNTQRSTGRAKNHNEMVTVVNMEPGLTPRGKYSKCQRHPNKDIQLHCVECNKIVCSECIVEVHQRHQFVSIEEAGTRLKGHLHTVLSPVKIFYQDELQGAYSNLEVAEEQYTVKTEQTIDEIHKRASQLHEDIDRIRDNMISSIETKQKQDMDEFVTTKETLNDRIERTGDVIRRVENAIENENDTFLLRSEHEFTTLVTQVERSLSLREPKPSRFTSGLSTEERVKDLFGNTTLVDEPDNTMASWRMLGENKLEVSKDLDLSRVLSVPVGEGQPIHTMVALGHSEVWFSSLSNTKQVQLFGIDGRTEKPLELEFSVKDVSVSRAGDLFISCFETRCVKHIRLSGTIETFFNVSPLHPLGIHVLRSGSVMVCVVDKITTDSRQLKPYSKRQLVKVSKTGKIIKRMAFNLDARLFTLPFKVNETVDEEVVVLDKTSKDKGRLIMFTRNEHIKFIYNGPQSIRTEYPFCPMDVVCDNFGHIIVIDSSNNAIHMLDKLGKVLRFHQIGRDWIDIPWSVAVDNRGLLLVGDSAGNMHVMRYLLNN